MRARQHAAGVNELSQTVSHQRMGNERERETYCDTGSLGLVVILLDPFLCLVGASHAAQPGQLCRLKTHRLTHRAYVST